MQAYYSLWNRYSVYDAERLAPAIEKLQSELETYQNSLQSIPESHVRLYMASWIYDQLHSPTSPLSHAVQEFYKLSTSYGNSITTQRLPEYPPVLSALVALNQLYDTISEKGEVDEVLAKLYWSNVFSTLLYYVKKIGSNTNMNRNINSDRTASIGSIYNVSSLRSNNANNRDNGVFGPMEGGRGRTKRSRQILRSRQTLRKKRE